MRTWVALSALGVTGVLWSGGAQVEPRPSPGSGIVTVAGTVDVGNEPSVRAAQSGDWKVAVANTPDVTIANTPSVTVAAPHFVKTRTRYEVIWPNGDRETVAVEQTARDGWVRVSDRRWINVGAARSVEAKP